MSPISPSTWPGGTGPGLPSSSCFPSPQMIQTSRTLIESADVVYGKLIQAQQAGGSWRAAPAPLWLWLWTQACPGAQGFLHWGRVRVGGLQSCVVGSKQSGGG